MAEAARDRVAVPRKAADERFFWNRRWWHPSYRRGRATIGSPV